MCGINVAGINKLTNKQINFKIKNLLSLIWKLRKYYFPLAFYSLQLFEFSFDINVQSHTLCCPNDCGGNLSVENGKSPQIEYSDSLIIVTV
jgi:hypothetical protein